jgi:hypothetical protein
MDSGGDALARVLDGVRSHSTKALSGLKVPLLFSRAQPIR